MKRRTRMLAILAAGAMAVASLAACGGGSNDAADASDSTTPSSSESTESSAATSDEAEPTTEDATSDEPVTITYFSWAPEAKFRPIIDKFEEKYPNITVDISSATGAANDYAQTLLTRIAGNQTPDVFHMSIETRTKIMGGGVAKDLTDEPFMTGRDPTGVALYTQDGKVYGMPLSGWMGAIIYNKDLLKQVGYDSVPDTMSEFIAMGKKLLDAGIQPYMDDPTVVSGSFIPMLGGWYAKQGITEADDVIFSGEKTFSEVWTPVIKQWNELITSGVMPKAVVGVNQDQIKQAFMTGQLAMYRSGAWDAGDLDSSGVNYAAAPFPAIDGGEPFVGGGPDSPYVISASLTGAKLAAAETFLAFMNSSEGLQLASENLGYTSTSANFDAQVPPQFEDVYKNYQKTGKYYWINWPKAGEVMGNDMTAQWQLLMQGQATPESVAETLQQTWTSATK